MKKWLRLVPALLLVIPGSAHAAQTTVTYVAAAALSSSTTVNLPAPVGRVAPLGGFSVVPTGTSIGVKIQDIGSAAGVPYSVCQGNNPEPTPTLCGDGVDDIDFAETCSDPTKFQQYGGLKPGNPVAIFIFSASLNCDGQGTVGTAIVNH